MKILVAGSYSHWNALEKHYINYMRPFVRDIQLYPWPDIVREYFGGSLFRKVQYRLKLGTNPKIREFNNLFLEFVKKDLPDIVWVFKGVDLQPETLIQIKELGIKIVNYNPDHPFIRTFRSGGGNEIENAIPLYDLIFCYSKDLIKEIEERFSPKIQLVHLPFGYDIPKETQQKADEIDLEVEEVKKLCFIGGPDSELRFQLLSELIKRDLPIDIYGLGWDKYFGRAKKNFRVFTGVYGEDYWLTLKRYRAQINIFRPHNINSHNMRSFEIPAIGGIQLAPDSIEHREFFQVDKEIKLYTSVEELEAISLDVLQMSLDEAKSIRFAAAERSRNSHYSYQERANIVLTAFHKMLEEK